MVHLLQTTQNLVISRCCFAEDGKKYTKNYNARAQLLFSSSNLLFGDALVAVAVRFGVRSLKFSMAATLRGHKQGKVE